MKRKLKPLKRDQYDRCCHPEFISVLSFDYLMIYIYHIIHIVHFSVIVS